MIGYHGAFTRAGVPQTYAIADVDTSGAFGTTVADVSALSHEIGEWMDDPFATNPTPSWGNIGQVVGCQTDLEVGDPLSGTAPLHKIRMASNGFTYHVQDLAFAAWFYGQSPSSGVNGGYSLFGNFTTAAGACR